MALRFSLLTVATLILVNSLKADDWPTFRRDYSRSGSTTETIDAEHLKQVWEHTDQAPRPAWPAPARWDAFGKIPDLRSMRNYDPVYHVTAVGDSCFYASSADDSVTCLDLVTGKTRWSFTTQGPVRIAPTWYEGNLYFGSDDGHAYCITADAGKLVWKMSPKPGERLVINDGRLISFWPVRTGVIVAEGTAYFGASLLPWKKSYLCAVDAKTGEPKGEGRYVKELDNQTFEGGMVISAKRLIAPQGRIAPLVYDRQDGKPLGNLAGATGGCFILVTEDNQVVLGGGNRKGNVTAAQITVAAPKKKVNVVSFPRGNAVVVRGDQIWVLDDHLLTAMNRKTTAKLWEKKIPHACEILLSGDALFVGGRDEVIAFDPDKGKELWRQPVKGRAYGLALANAKLLVSTDEGSIHSFAGSTVKPAPATPDVAAKAAPKEKSTQPELVLREGPTLRFTSPSEAEIRWKTAQPTPTLLEFGEGDDLRLLKSQDAGTNHVMKIDGLRKGRLYQFRVKAEVDKAIKSTATMECDMHANYLEPERWMDGLEPRQVDQRFENLTRVGGAQGFCLIVAPTDETLAHRIAKRTRMNVVVVDNDAAAVEKARAAYRQAKIYGPALNVTHVEKLDALPLPPGFANLVVCGPRAGRHAEYLFQFVRPEGGCLMIDPLGADGVKPERRGRLAGAADWTHQYGKADNSGFAGEQLADASKADDLEVNWFGQPGPRFNIDRNPRKASPLSSKGRLFVQGHKRVGALDAFNGQFLWTLELPRFARYNIPHDCSNWCCDDDHLYLAIDDQCWTLAAANGKVEKVQHLDEILSAEQAKDAEWGYLAKVGDVVLGSAVKRGSHFLGYWGSEHWYDAKNGQRYICSNHLFALPTGKDQPLWTWSKGSIVNPTITVAEGRVTFVESRNPDLVKNPSGQLGNEIWKDLWMTSLDLATGKPAWSQELKSVPGTAAFHLIQAEGKTIVTSSDKGKFQVQVFDAKSGEPIWNKDYPWEADHHGKHLSHPAVVGGHLILRPHVIELASGKQQHRGFPAGHGCGAYCATKNLLIFRGNEVVLWDIDHNANTRFPRLRPDCWISTIPANGMLLSPEGGGGCSCGQWLEMSVGFLPKAVK